VYQAMVVVLLGIILYAFLKARRDGAAQVSTTADDTVLEAGK